jgi:hypothetical protein
MINEYYIRTIPVSVKEKGHIFAGKAWKRGNSMMSWFVGPKFSAIRWTGFAVQRLSCAAGHG